MIRVTAVNGFVTPPPKPPGNATYDAFRHAVYPLLSEPQRGGQLHTSSGQRRATPSALSARHSGSSDARLVRPSSRVRLSTGWPDEAMVASRTVVRARATDRRLRARSMRVSQNECPRTRGARPTPASLRCRSVTPPFLRLGRSRSPTTFGEASSSRTIPAHSAARHLACGRSCTAFTSDTPKTGHDRNCVGSVWAPVPGVRRRLSQTAGQHPGLETLPLMTGDPSIPKAKR